MASRSSSRTPTDPAEPGTQIVARPAQEEAQVKGVVSRDNITVITMENTAMWQQAGFLADAFAVFKLHGYSVDLVSTSESTVTVSLDPQMPAHYDERRMGAFLADLEDLCRVSVHNGCVSISLVGNAIRTILGRLSAALDVFQDRHVHMVTQSANDLNLTLVVDPDHALSLVRKLHQLLIASQAENRPEFGPSWTELTRQMQPAAQPEPWWVGKAGQLSRLLDGRESAYVYDLDTARAAARRLRGTEVGEPPALRASRPMTTSICCRRWRKRAWLSSAFHWRRCTTCWTVCPARAPDRHPVYAEFRPAQRIRRRPWNWASS